MNTEVKIGANTFAVSPLTAMRSFVLQPRIGPVIAEAGALFFGLLRDVAKSQGGEDAELSVSALLEADVDVDKIAAALGRIFVKLPPAELQSITRELLAGSTMDGRQLFAAVQGEGDSFDIVMRGRTLDVWKLLWHALNVNYPDFFGALVASGKRAPGASPSEASTTSPTSGPATGS